ncbi:MAG: RNA-binding S4 domain-containing protein [Thermoleophilaceae bacterium]
MSQEVEIRGEMIRLGQLLKLVGAVGAGGDAKALLAEEPAIVNGEPEARRGRQLREGDEVRIGGESFVLRRARS